MDIKINPLPISGNWDSGYALDKHIVHSEYLGQDMYGHDRYDNTRSDLGELLYQYKYNGKHDNISIIGNVACEFIKEWEEACYADSVIPVPPSQERSYQPTKELAKSIAKYFGMEYCDILIKTNSEEMKNKGVPPEISLKSQIDCGDCVLLVDDLYSTGATLTACVNKIKENTNVSKVFVLTLTKTRG